MSFNKNDSSFILRWSKKIRSIELLGGKCLKCGNNNVFVLGFHHKDKNKEKNKENDITHMLGRRWSILEKEILKCELLCRNCHMEIHNDSKDVRFSDLKSDLLKYKGIVGCQSCGYVGSKNSSLDFHHRIESEKNFKISKELTKRKSIVNNILRELDKCDVLCGNCHLINHQEVERFNKLRDKIYFKVKFCRELPRPIDINMVMCMYENGMKQIEIAKKIGCSKSTISKILTDRSMM